MVGVWHLTVSPGRMLVEPMDNAVQGAGRWRCIRHQQSQPEPQPATGSCRCRQQPHAGTCFHRQPGSVSAPHAVHLVWCRSFGCQSMVRAAAVNMCEHLLPVASAGTAGTLLVQQQGLMGYHESCRVCSRPCLIMGMSPKAWGLHCIVCPFFVCQTNMYPATSAVTAAWCEGDACSRQLHHLDQVAPQRVFAALDRPSGLSCLWLATNSPHRACGVCCTVHCC